VTFPVAARTSANAAFETVREIDHERRDLQDDDVARADGLRISDGVSSRPDLVEFDPMTVGMFGDRRVVPSITRPALQHSVVSQLLTNARGMRHQPAT
jgi:hypothetical protein